MRRRFLFLTLLVLFPSITSLAACKGRDERTVYKIEAEYLAEGIVEASMTADVVNDTDNALSTLSFSLWANAYREGAKYSPVSELFKQNAYYAGESFGGVEISSLDGGTWEIAGEDENILRVTLPEPLYPDERAEISICFQVNLAKVNHRLGIGEHCINLMQFYPVLCPYSQEGFAENVYAPYGDPFVGECADFEVDFTFPSEYTLVCSGNAQEREGAQNGKSAYHIVAENARDVSFVLGKFEKLVKEGETPIEYYYFSDGNPERTLKAAADSFGYYSRTFCAYGYPRYAVVQTDLPYGGMECTGLSLISHSLTESEIPTVVAHETAHQWWYAMIGSNQYSNAWQDEGLAEYSTALFLGAYPEYGSGYRETVALSESAYRAFFSVWSQTHGEANTEMTRPLTSFQGDYEYRSIAYDKGVILFDRLREAIGERRFFASLKNYAEKYCFRTATAEDLYSCFPASCEGLFLSFTKGLCVI